MGRVNGRTRTILFVFISALVAFGVYSNTLRHEFVWDGLDAARQRVASGAYFYRIEAGPDSAVYKMLLMK